MVKFRDIQEKDIPSLMNLELRSADIQELETSSGTGWLKALLQAVVAGWKTWIAESERGIVSVGGFWKESDIIIPWLVATEDIHYDLIAVLKFAEKRLAEALEDHVMAMCMIDARNEHHIRWVKQIGFTVEESDPINLNGYPFYKFWKRSTNV